MTPDELRAWRKRAGLSQAELAALLGVHPMTISKAERGLFLVNPLMPLALWALDHGYLERTEHV